MIIDAHIHVGTWDHPDFLGRQSTMAETVAVLEDCGIDGAVVLPTDQCDNAGLLASARDVLRGGFAGPLWALAWVRPVADGVPGQADLAWVEQNHGQLAGLKIHPSLARKRVTDDVFAPALDVAEAHDLVVLVHCGRWQEIASYRFAIEVAKRRPKLRFLLAHAGGDTPPLATAAADMVADEAVDNVWFDFSGLREFWVVERNVAKIGAERYLMGSDFSLAHPRMYLGAVAGMALSDEQRGKILGGNALELFGARSVTP